MPSPLNWKELEILKIVTLSKDKNKTEIIKELKNIFPLLENTPSSSFYMMFERLRDEGLISVKKIKGAGHKVFVELTAKGLLVLTESMKTAFDYFLPTLISTFITEIRMVCEDNLKNLSIANLAVVAPEVVLTHPSFQQNFNYNLLNNNVRKFNLQMFYSGTQALEGYENIKSSYNDIPIKDGFFNSIISIISLGFHNKKHHKELLQELYRVLKKKGKIILIEARYLYSILLQSMTSIIGDVNPLLKDLQIDVHKFQKENLLKLTQKIFPKTSIGKNFAEIVIIVGEK